MIAARRGSSRSLQVMLTALAVLVATHHGQRRRSVLRAGCDNAAQGLAEVIVVLEPGADPVSVAQELGVKVTHIYRHVFTGFAGVMPQSSVAAARANHAVRSISPDGQVQSEAQIMPTGVSRVGTPIQLGTTHLAIPSPVDVDIAIVDTGIARNSDLLVVGGSVLCQEQG